MSNLSYVTQSSPDSPWQTYLSQVDRVVPYLGPLARWSETLKRGAHDELVLADFLGSEEYAGRL